MLHRSIGLNIDPIGRICRIPKNFKFSIVFRHSSKKLRMNDYLRRGLKKKLHENMYESFSFSCLCLYKQAKGGVQDIQELSKLQGKYQGLFSFNSAP